MSTLRIGKDPKALWDELWSELAEVDWKRPPYRGILTKVAEEHSVSKFRVWSAIRRRTNPELAIALMRKKRELDARAREVLKCA